MRPWAEEKLYQIIDYRYNTWLPTVVNAISTVEVMDETRPRIASRLKDSTRQLGPHRGPRLS